MLRKIQLIFLVCLFPGFVFSQTRLKYNTPLQHELQTDPFSQRMISVVVKGNIESIKTAVRQVGGTFKYHVNNVASVSLPLNQLHVLAAMKEVERIEGLYGEGHLLDDMTFVNANITAVHDGYAPLLQGYDGSGTVIAVLDDGIDFHHPDFMNADGTTRIKYLWDQTMITGGTVPQPYNYGQEWDAAAIDAGQCTHVEPEFEFGHGSNVAGIAAGNGLAINNFTGIAPATDIVVVAMQMDENFLLNMVDATEYAFTKAASLGKPCVINASLGTYSGSHDGYDLAAQMIDNLISEQNGRAFVCAAGNAGNFPFHLGYQTQPDSSFTWLKYNNSLEKIAFEWWIDKDQAPGFYFSVGADNINPYGFSGRLKYYNLVDDFNITSGFDVVNDTLWNGISLVGTVTFSVYEFDSTYACDIEIEPAATSQYWRFITNGTGRFDAWSSSSLTGTSDIIYTSLPDASAFPDINRYHLPDTEQTIVSSFTCSDKVITVANFTNRTQYIDYYGDLIISTTDTTGALAVSSSLGPTRDGRIKPDISAPGNRTLTAGALWQLNSFILTQPYKVALGGMHNTNGGTSMASPVVAGIAALYFEKNPDASYKEVKDAILLTAYKDDHTGYTLPDNKWGYGKADAFAALSTPLVYGCTDPAAVNYNPLANVSDASCSYTTGISLGSGSMNIFSCFPNPFHDFTHFSFNEPTSENKQLLITDVSGKMVDVIEIAESVTDYNYTRHLPAGIYFARIKSGDKNSSLIKIVAY
jgi:subtilisin family serine protease